MTACGRAMRPAVRCAAILMALAFIAGPARADERIEIFDAHMHYNWEPKPYYGVDEVLALFKKHRVTGILATSRPNTGTHALMDARPAGLQIVPFIRPYRVRADIQTWFGDPFIFDLVQEECKRGYYRGIGEFHISGKAAENEWVKKTVDFAVEQMAKGMDRTEAIVDAGRKRARPIVMTTIAMAAGMMPSALAFGAGGEFRSPMALAVIGGLVFSTILSLVFVPAMFMMMDDLGALIWHFGKKLLVSHGETEPPGDHGAGLKPPPAILRSPAAE